MALLSSLLEEDKASRPEVEWLEWPIKSHPPPCTAPPGAPPVLLRYLLQAASLLAPWSAELRAMNEHGSVPHQPRHVVLPVLLILERELGDWDTGSDN